MILPHYNDCILLIHDHLERRSKYNDLVLIHGNELTLTDDLSLRQFNMLFFFSKQQGISCACSILRVPTWPRSFESCYKKIIFINLLE